MSSAKATVLYLGLDGFPVRDAGIQRQLQICKALTADNTRVFVICRKGVHSEERIANENIQRSGTYEGIEYVYASGTPKYNENFIIRNCLKLYGGLVEFFLILSNKFINHVEFAIVKTDDLLELKYYFFLSRLLKIKIVFDYLEFRSSLESRSIKEYVDEKSFDFVFHRYVDSMIIISHFLTNHIKKIAPELPHLIIPPIIDFEKFEKNQFVPPINNYFLFCGSTTYIDIIKFIIGCYHQSKAEEHHIALVLVIIGDKQEIDNLKEQTKQNEGINILSYLPYEELIGYYKQAKALLIPLTDNLQDKARFPFKISEYTAAGRPIISSDSGAVINYFQNEVNALLAKTDDASDFTAKLNFIIDHPQQAEEIAAKGHETGLIHFNYKSYSQKIKALMTATK
jgi:glycosyltransferase involved in cell wall biosynthesis